MSEKEMRELDEWIATRIFGWQKFREEEFPHRTLWSEGDPGSRVWDEPDFYTTDPAAAMQVLEKCVEFGGVLVTRPFYHNEKKELWTIRDGEMGDMTEVGETLPLAICKFAKELFSK